MSNKSKQGSENQGKSEDNEPKEAQAARQGNLGPAIHPGGEIDTGDVPVPPYEGRQTSGETAEYIDQDVDHPDRSERPDGDTPPDYEGTGPTHTPGTTRGEDVGTYDEDDENKVSRQPAAGLDE